MIEVSNLDKFYGKFQALKNINVSVAQGERVVICGPSGSGKSTLIRCSTHINLQIPQPIDADLHHITPLNRANT